MSQLELTDVSTMSPTANQTGWSARCRGTYRCNPRGGDTRTNPPPEGTPMKFLQKSHHIRQLLETAAYTGQVPPRSLLDKLDKFDLPDGESMTKFRGAINAAAQRIVATRATAGYGAAFTLAGDECGAIAQRMSETQLAAVGDPDPEPMDDITRRMFGR